MDTSENDLPKSQKAGPDYAADFQQVQDAVAAEIAAHRREQEKYRASVSDEEWDRIQNTPIGANRRDPAKDRVLICDIVIV